MKNEEIKNNVNEVEGVISDSDAESASGGLKVVQTSADMETCRLCGTMNFKDTLKDGICKKCLEKNKETNKKSYF